MEETMNEQIEQTNEISLFDLYKIIRDNIILILLCTFIIGIIAGIYAYVVANETYKSNAYVMVQVQREGTTTGEFDLVNAQRLLATTAELIKMPVVLDKVIDELNLDMSVGQIQKNLTVTSSNTSYFINVTYVSEDKELSKEIVNTVISEAIAFANAEIPVLNNNIIRTSYAQRGVYDSPNKPLYIVIGLILGAILGVGITFLREMLNNTFKTKDQLENVLGYQVLGVIPQFEVKETK
jgi:capsular polysaccharide biosynthesis protein